MDNVIGVDEAAEFLGLSPGTVKNYCAQGKIEAKKIGKTWVIDKNKLDKGMDKMKTVFNQLEGSFNIEEASRHGKHVMYFVDKNELAEQFGLEDNQEEFAERVSNEFGIDVDDITADFITIDDENAADGFLFHGSDDLNDVTHYIKNNDDFKKFIK